MEFNDKVMDIINNNEKAQRMMAFFEDKADKEGLTGNDYEENRKTMLGLIIASIPEAMKAMSDEVYTEINAR